jgi:hypothetical protein
VCLSILSAVVPLTLHKRTRSNIAMLLKEYRDAGLLKPTTRNEQLYDILVAG